MSEGLRRRRGHGARWSRPSGSRWRVARRLAGGVGLAALAGGLAAPAGAALSTPTAPEAPAQEAPGQDAPGAEPYLVVLERPADDFSTASAAAREARSHAEGHDVAPTHVYSHALAGYSAELTDEQVADLEADGDVAYVQEDTVLELYQVGPAAQTVPTGVRRVFAPDNPNLGVGGPDDRRVDVDVAIIDSGVAFHPDLNVVDRVNCWEVSGGGCAPGVDPDISHGTHVAGIAAAVNNGDGVVGVAPGARVWSQQVCNNGCPTSAVVAGIDYVTAHAADIEVANMSLGGPGPNQAVADAISASVNAGVVYVVAAGNDNQDAANHWPAQHPDVVTVSALADSDGRPGGTGGPLTCRPASRDDYLADYSNWGPLIELAAPGTCINSTIPSGYGVISGTSMASPHAAGAAGLLTSGGDKPTNRAEVLAVRDTLVRTGNRGWTHVPRPGDDIHEPLLDVRDAATYAPDRYLAANAAFEVSCNATTLTCAVDGSASSSPGGPITAYRWAFGDGATATGATASHTFAVPGFYYITLNVSSAGATGSTDAVARRVMVGNPTWRPAQDAPGGLMRFGEAQCPDDPDGYYKFAGRIGFGATNEAWRYDATDDAWTQLAPFPGRGVEGITAVCTDDGRIHALGGSGGEREHWVYDTHANTWTAAPALPQGTLMAAAGYWQGDVYLFGGGTPSSPTATVQVFDIATGTWGTGPSLAVPRTHTGYTQLGSNLFVAGGFGPDGIVGDTFRFDMATREWRLGPRLSVARAEPALVATGTALYAMGGFPPQPSPPIQVGTDVVERLQLDLGSWPGGSWTALDPLPNPAGFVGGRCNPRPGGAHVAVLSGGTATAIVNEHWQTPVTEACAR